MSKPSGARELSPLLVDGDRVLIEFEGSRGAILATIRRQPKIHPPQREPVRRTRAGKSPQRRRAGS
jgi:hypothetical protein